MEISMKMIPTAVIQLFRKHGQLALTKLGKNPISDRKEILLLACLRCLFLQSGG